MGSSSTWTAHVHPPLLIYYILIFFLVLVCCTIYFLIYPKKVKRKLLDSFLYKITAVTVPVLDFALMRERTGVPMGKDILDEVPMMMMMEMKMNEF